MMSVFRGAGILLPQLLLGLFWAGSHDLLDGWNQTDEAILTLLVLFIMTPLSTLGLLIFETARAFKIQGPVSQKAFWLGLAMILFGEALAIDLYLLTHVRM